ncbi:SUMF1/EgtB/PvdO family nonheme iron enzyme [Prosthecochloris sp.]|uniref:SUMF1/EgtB/PvdO family nonheme iron enzyme n=1 Tax=Prosthecochloris sp. TaxID=290513 RepID=UPI00257CEAB0|nr:SUMF1/EgtB/PvdO family nonheme iron enzyme [Prosthecochloris sp.]
MGLSRFFLIPFFQMSVVREVNNLYFAGQANPSSPETATRSLMDRKKILIASPSDVQEERDCARRLIDEWNRLHKEREQLDLMPVMWEQVAWPENGDGVQETITRQLDIRNLDAVIGIFWTRIGTPTKVASGGAVEEIGLLEKAGKPVMLYFCTRLADLYTLEDDQWQGVKTFRQECQKKHYLTWEYKTHKDFEEKLRVHLHKMVTDKFCQSDAGRPKDVRTPQLTRYADYRQALQNRLTLLVDRGIDEYTDIEIPLKEVFIDLHIEERYGKKISHDDLLKQTFYGKCPTNVLLLIGDPGAGKSTLLQYYAMRCLEDRYHSLFHDAIEVRVVFIELRRLVFDDDRKQPLPLAEQVVSSYQALSLQKEEVESWWPLQGSAEKMLVLLDGLDEVTESERRQAICDWIDEEASVNRNRCFIVTTRRTGYAASEGIELKGTHKSATLADLDKGQQKKFLRKWFRAATAYEQENGRRRSDESSPEEQADALYAYIYPEDNQSSGELVDDMERKRRRGVQEIAVIPLLLKLMALLYKLRGYKPDSRISLYRLVFKYLLHGREKARKLALDIDPEQSETVLAQLAYTMQKQRRLDCSEKEMKDVMELRFQSQNTPVTLDKFFTFIVGRSGILKPNGEAYRFWHKTFQEYLASREMARQSRSSDDFVGSIVRHFGDTAWEWDETLKFYFAQVEDRVFDSFMEQLFVAGMATDVLDNNLQLMQTMISEAKECSVTALCGKLNDPEIALRVHWYVLDCLEVIGKPAALDKVRAFAERIRTMPDDDPMRNRVLEKASDLVNQLERASGYTATPVQPALSRDNMPDSYRNPHELDAEYLLIRGGEYLYSQPEPEGQKVLVGDLYVARYPVTNRQYRSFIAFLEGKSADINTSLKEKEYRQALRSFAADNPDDAKGMQVYLQSEKDLAKLFTPDYDDNRKFNKDDQPVVGVSWYAARAYCFWLSMLDPEGWPYMLPTEQQWEWAAGGKRPLQGQEQANDCPQKVRKYPWGDEPEPTVKHANYDENEGQTTPVGSYPDGATLDGLYDMAGNVWEWMENWADDDKDVVALRGGSWDFNADYLLCSARDLDDPQNRNDVIGFRVVRPSHLPDHLDI